MAKKSLEIGIRKQRYLRKLPLLLILVFSYTFCVNIPATSGGSISGEIYLDTVNLTFSGGDIVLLVADDYDFNNILVRTSYKIEKERYLFNLYGLKNGRYYLLAFEDSNNNGIFDLNIPLLDVTVSENYGIYDNDWVTSDATIGNGVVLEVSNNVIENIQFLIDTSH